MSRESLNSSGASLAFRDSPRKPCGCYIYAICSCPVSYPYLTTTGDETSFYLPTSNRLKLTSPQTPMFTKDSILTFIEGVGYSQHKDINAATAFAKEQVRQQRTVHFFQPLKTLAPKVDIEETAY